MCYGLWSSLCYRSKRYALKMDHKTRVAQLDRLIEERFDGKLAELEKAGGPSMSMVGQWRSGRRQLGERAARKIELKLRLKTYYLEGPNAPLSDRTKDFAKIIDALPDAQKDHFFPIIMQLIGPYLTSEQVEEKMPITKTVAAGKRKGNE